MNAQVKKVVLGTALLCAAAVCIATETKEKATKPEKPKSLLTMLREWQYPKSEFNEAEMSDGSVQGIVSSNCKAVLTTTDSFEKVTSFYTELLKLEEREKNVNAKHASAVLVNDCSQERACKVRVFTINARLTSTTIVVSRGKDEKRTHITWSHFVRHPVN